MIVLVILHPKSTANKQQKMDNKTYSWGDSRRINSYSAYFKRLFGSRIQKVTIDAGFSCPNRDGTLSVGGCTFCNNDAFNPSYCKPEKSIRQQIEEGIEFHAARYRSADKFLAYFQAYSNTHKPLEELKRIFEEALSVDKVVGIVVGTRPDCVDEKKLDYLAKLSQNSMVIIEYGVESTYNSTLERINRGHTFECASHAIEQTAERNIPCGAHFILGLPGETRQMMLDQMQTINSLPIDTIKFHQLQIFKGSAMEHHYAKYPKEYNLFEKDEYIDFFIEILSHLSPRIVLERFAGEAPPRFHVAPHWGTVRNNELLSILEKRLEQTNRYQGCAL